MNLSWKDAAHYGSAAGLFVIGALGAAGVHIPGVTIDPTVCFATGAGIFVGGFKGGVISGMKVAIAFLALALALVVSPVRAADLPTKAAPVLSNVYPTKSCGMFYGLNAEGGSGIVNGAPAGTVVIGGDIGALIGYACPSASIPWFLEFDADFQNLNAGNAGFALTGPAHLTQEAAIQTPLLSWIGNLINIGQNNIPAIQPMLPPGVTINSSPQSYIGVTLSEDDISASYGLSSAHEWLLSPGVRTGLLFNLSGPNGVQAIGDTYAGIEFQSNSVCLGALGECPKLGPRFVAGFSLKM